jgi:hypothetical protein
VASLKYPPEILCVIDAGEKFKRAFVFYLSRKKRVSRVMSNTPQEIGQRLEAVYMGGQQFNQTARLIIDRLKKGDVPLARNEFRVDGDKIPGYERWGREFMRTFIDHYGCRVHQVVDCPQPFCLMYRQSYENHLT